MKIKAHKHLIIFVLAIIITVSVYFWFIHSSYFEGFKIWSQSNLITYFLVLVSVKIIGIVWPPLPGGVFTLASVPIVGWPIAYVADLLGSIIGSTIAFLIARRWGFEFLDKIFDQNTLEKIKNIKIKKEREIESIFLMRFFGASVIEVVCYGAGILGVGYRNFMIASVSSHIAVGMPVFYLTGTVFGEVLNSRGAIVGILAILFVIFLFYKLKHRYFEFR